MRDRLLEIQEAEEKFRRQQYENGSGKRSAKKARRKTAILEKAIERSLKK